MTKISANISAPEVRVLRDADVTVISVQTATASYADLVGSKVDAANASSIAYTVKNSHATLTTKYKVMGSIDDITYVEVQAEATVSAAGGTGSYSSTNPVYRYYKLQIIDGSGHGTLEGAVITKN